MQMAAKPNLGPLTIYHEDQIIFVCIVVMYGHKQFCTDHRC